MREIRVDRWTDLHEALFADSWNEALSRHRSRFAFRGVSRATHSLCSSLSRLGPSAAQLETPLLRTFRKYARGLARVDDSVWNWLAVGQHHGLPTRLLDWTFSPYVALHFLTENRHAMNDDGAVWVVDYVNARDTLPAALRRVLEEEEASVFTAEMLSLAAGSLRELDALGEDFVVFLEPPSLDERIVNQYALFSLTPGCDGDAHARWIAGHEHLATKIVVAGSLKWEVRDKLDQANVTERVLYPGLDGLSRFLTRYYAPRS